MTALPILGVLGGLVLLTRDVPTDPFMVPRTWPLGSGGLSIPWRGLVALFSLAAGPWDHLCPSLLPRGHVWPGQGQSRAGVCPVEGLRAKVPPWGLGVKKAPG